MLGIYGGAMGVPNGLVCADQGRGGVKMRPEGGRGLEVRQKQEKEEREA